MANADTARPVLLDRTSHQFETVERWAVGSRSSAGGVYVVTAIGNAAGLQHRCSCPAGTHGRRCWHVEAVEAAASDQAARPAPMVIGGLSSRDVTIDDLWGCKPAA